MPRLKIDNREVEVPPGATILDAAEKLGIDIPSLCFLKGRAASTSCLACLVKVGRDGRLVPSCATAATAGMVVESETPEVHQARRNALELLLSDHLGDCLAPCWLGCPAQMNIPQMLRQIAAGDLRGAIATVKADIALPAVLGRICPAPCEKACRRTGLDGAVVICLLKRFVADADLASADPYLPECRPATGRRVAILGGGPTGLAAAYYLAQLGHAPTIFEENDRLGGRLHTETTESALPRSVLEAEIAQITRLGIEVRPRTGVGRDVALADLRHGFDALLVACGASAAGQAQPWGLPAGPSGIHVARRTFETGVSGVFAAGNAIRAKGMVVRSVADGKEAAVAIDQFLSGQEVRGPTPPLTVRIGRMEPCELRLMATLAGEAARREAAEGLTAAEAVEQAARCLHCDCRGLGSCKLRKYAALYGADPRRYKAQRRPFQLDAQHAEVIYESGKCIDCGLCIQITAAAGEQLGLAFVGRGFNVRVGVPLGHSLAEALTRVAAQCVAACPTAAMAWKDPATVPAPFACRDWPACRASGSPRAPAAAQRVP